MTEQLRSPLGRVAIGLVASAALFALVLLVEPGMLAITPALLVPIWASLIPPGAGAQHPRLIRVLLALGVATLLAGVVAFFLAN